jgi:hypothetical protein
LRAALDWSYQLLSNEEQRLLRHLAVFPAGFTFEAAEAVGGAGRTGPPIVEELSSLVSKSLCERVNSTSPTRWRLLETIRAYALEKLAENGEYPGAARQHAAYFRDLVSPVAASATIWLSRDDVAPLRPRDRECPGGARLGILTRWRRRDRRKPDGCVRTDLGPVVADGRVSRPRSNACWRPRPPDTPLGQAGEWRMWIAYAHALAMTSAPVGRGRAAFKMAISLTADVDDVDLQAGLLYGQWSVEFMSGDQGAALATARQLAAVTPRGGDAMRLAGDRILGTSLLYAGKLADAQHHLQRVVDLYAAPSDGHNPLLFVYDPQVLSRARLAHVLGLRGADGPGL